MEMSGEDVPTPDKRMQRTTAGWGDDWNRIEEREINRFAHQGRAVEQWRARVLKLRAKLQAMRERNLRLMALRRRLARERNERDRRPPSFLFSRPDAGSDNGKGGMSDAPRNHHAAGAGRVGPGHRVASVFRRWHGERG